MVRLASCSGMTLEEEVAQAKRVTVSNVEQAADLRICESVEASHSSHDLAGAVAKGEGSDTYLREPTR